MNCDAISISIGIAGIIIGAILSFYFYRKSLRIKEPCWRITSNNINVGFNDKVDGLNISYKNKKVKTLTISKILFWNNGKETIYRRDIETKNKLKIVASEEIKILNATILTSKNESNQLNIEIGENGHCVFIEFDYLDNEQGSVFQIIHTGTSSKDLQLVGDIIGAKTIQNKTVSPKWFDWLEYVSDSKIIQKITSRKSTAIFSVIIGFVFLLLGSTNLLSYSRIFPVANILPPSISDIFFSIFYVLISILFLYIGFFVLTPEKPKGFDIYFED